MHLRLNLTCNSAQLARVFALTALVALATGSPASAAEELAILPSEVVLSGPEARQMLVVEERRDGQFVGQVSADLVFESSDPKVVQVEAGVLKAVGNGQAMVTAKAGGRTAQAKVRVAGLDQPFTWSFRNHVESVMAKSGCSSGPCHGAQAGKNGFKISLFGYDPEGDFLAITRQARGRRIVPSDPGHSLLLTKPTGAIPHKGGVRFDVDSLEYRVLVDWIAAGMPAPQSNDPRLVKLEILPPGVVLKPGNKQQFLVRAHFTDGHVEDVTRWAKYTSTNESVAKVDDRGAATIGGFGEGAITAWYLSKVIFTTISSPYTQPVAKEVFARAERHNFIDDQVLEKLVALNIPPSPLAGDEEFIRRAYLDSIGMLPSADEVRRFLADKSPKKRDALIESLLHRPEWVDYWAYKWSDLLLVNSDRLKFGAADKPGAAMWSYYTWIRNKVEADTPWDVMVRELVTAQGNSLEQGSANFFILHKDPLDMAETTTVAFLGMSINCARCHNHPLEKWTNNQYYAMANLYSRVRTKANADGSHTVFAAADGELIQPLTGKPQPPTPLDGQPLSLDAPGDRRVPLARWLTSPENPYFSRSITNRVWANFLGAGLVEMVDDMRLTNPASNEKLLAATSKFLVDNRFDLKALMRVIMQSATYQRTSKTLPGNAQDKRFYSHYYPKRMLAEVMLDAMSQVTGEPTMFPGYPAGWRAMQLPDSMIASYFLETFGRAERAVTCDCERATQPSMVQVLHISNGKTLNGKLESANNQLSRWLKAKMPETQMIEELYLSALSRYPTSKEKTEILQTLAAAPPAEHRAALEDLYWGVLSSTEFLLNH